MHHTIREGTRNKYTAKKFSGNFRALKCGRQTTTYQMGKFPGNFNLFGHVNFLNFSENFRDIYWKLSVFSALNLNCSHLNS
jgi:hypothetical protein